MGLDEKKRRDGIIILTTLIVGSLCMSYALFSMLYLLNLSSLTRTLVGRYCFVPILQMIKPRHREVRRGCCKA